MLTYKTILRFDRNRINDKTRLSSFSRAWYLKLDLKYSPSNYVKWSPEIRRLSPNKIRYMYVDMFRKFPKQLFQYPTTLINPVKSYLKCLTNAGEGMRWQSASEQSGFQSSCFAKSTTIALLLAKNIQHTFPGRLI